MSNRIKVLPNNLINQIAAGEVIERPASIVKELVENAIDAGATRVEIDITAGGLERIEIRDNGYGMSPEDLRLAVIRHATSKISSEADLFNISSLGFRGEALPSIASVSRLLIKSRPVEAEQGYSLALIHGSDGGERVVGMPHGTIITVTELFQNVPARLKFMGSSRAEAARITTLYQQVALSHPEVAFHYYRDGKEIAHTSGDGRVLNTITALFSAELARNLVAVDFHYHEYTVTGLVSKPDYAKSNRKQEFFFLNKRIIEDTTIRHGLESAYGQMLNNRKFPVAFLYLKLPASDVDVNVHPAKREVRFTRNADIHALVYGGVREALANHQSVQQNAPPEKPYIASSQYSAKRDKDLYIKREIPRLDLEIREQSTVFQSQTKVWDEVIEDSPLTTASNPSGGQSPQSPFENIDSQEAFSQIMVLGQIHDSFIVLQNKKGMVVIDQHAAHERIIIDRLRNQQTDRVIQYFAIPLTLSFPNLIFNTIKDYLPEINQLGLITEPFGTNSLIVRGIPEFLTGKLQVSEIKSIFTDVFGEGNKIATWYDNMLIEISCRAAIKIHQSLTRSEIIGLIKHLAQAENWRFCPHGRPTIWEVPFSELERIFKRV